MLFFDTSTAIEWLRGNPTLENTVLDQSIEISTITIYELLCAAKRRGEKEITTVEGFIQGCRVLPVTERVARRGAFLKADLLKRGKEKMMANILIAASAEIEGLRLITFDGDFNDIKNLADIDILILKKNPKQ